MCQELHRENWFYSIGLNYSRGESSTQWWQSSLTMSHLWQRSPRCSKVENTSNLSPVGIKEEKQDFVFLCKSCDCAVGTLWCCLNTTTGMCEAPRLLCELSDFPRANLLLSPPPSCFSPSLSQNMWWSRFHDFLCLFLSFCVRLHPSAVWD